ncbi:hypothetical protein [uncultured Lamprocystis sp.]|jgi:hypothetical protein|nr:hypothetical protein [uncultured Lamprocystis sp.]
MSDLQRPLAQPPRPALMLRLLGSALLVSSVYLVSCQALFFPV